MEIRRKHACLYGVYLDFTKMRRKSMKVVFPYYGVDVEKSIFYRKMTP